MPTETTIYYNEMKRNSKEAKN